MKTTNTIRNCDKQFHFVCPQKWGELQETEDKTKRFCDKCEQTVYFCITDDETRKHARAGHCIAREIPDTSELPWLATRQANGTDRTH